MSLHVKMIQTLNKKNESQQQLINKLNKQVESYRSEFVELNARKPYFDLSENN